MLFVVAVPLLIDSEFLNSNFTVESGWPPSWLVEGASLSRNVGRFGNSSYSRAKVKHATFPGGTFKFAPQVELTNAIVISRLKQFKILIIVGSIAPGHEQRIEDLRRPGKAWLAEATSTRLGLQVDFENTTMATTVISPDFPELSFHSGILVGLSDKAFRFEVTYSLVAGAIAAERVLLDKATNIAIDGDPLGFRARKSLASIKNWLSIPSSDSPSLISQVALLRSSLALDERRDQALRALETQVKAVDFALAAFFGTFGVSFSVASAISQPLDSGGEAWVAVLAVSLSVAVFSALATFSASRNR